MTPFDRRRGFDYRVDEDEITRFHADGYVHLRGVLSEKEMLDIEETYRRFLTREIAVDGRDFCDMSSHYGKSIDEFAIVNVMLPRHYHPEWRDNLFERRGASIASQLQGKDLAIDYDQLLAKPPRRDDGIFHWHQDLAYWPVTPDTRTATLWLALDDATEANGCMRFVVGSNREAALRPHRPLYADRAESHTLVADVDEAHETIRLAEIKRGDVTVHSERVLHGSGPNRSDGWRRAYVLAFRSRATIAEERRQGFTHSHTDALDVLNRVGDESTSGDPT